MDSAKTVPVPRVVLDLGAHAGEASAPYIKPGDKWILVDNQQYLEYENWAVLPLPKGLNIT